MTTRGRVDASPDASPEAWSPDELRAVAQAHELEIAVQRPDGTSRRWTPIWVVTVGHEVYVRTWYRRDTGWFGAALRSGRARIRVPGLDTGVAVDDVGAGPAGLRERVDTAYLDKYGRAGSASMVAVNAAATTLRLRPAPSAPTAGDA